MQNKISSRDSELSCVQKKKPRSIFSDTSLEFIKASEELDWNHEIIYSAQIRKNGAAERAV